MPPVDTAANDAAPPALWNPNAAASWSLILSPAFGAYLHMLNWQALGQPERAEASRRWFVASLVVLGLMALTSLVVPDSGAADLLLSVLSIGLLVAWYYAAGKRQAAYVVARLGRDYPRRSWLRPLAWALGLFVLYVLAVAVLAALAGLLRG